MKRWCRHCDAARSRRRSGLCDPCNTYRAKYGVLPPTDVLVRRERRRELKRMEITCA